MEKKWKQWTLSGIKQTRVINLNKNQQSYDIYIGRHSKYGNPFVIGRDGTRDQVVEKYKEFLFAPEQADLRMDMKKNLVGKTLGCFCKPLKCHGDVIIYMLNNKNP